MLVNDLVCVNERITAQLLDTVNNLDQRSVVHTQCDAHILSGQGETQKRQQQDGRNRRKDFLMYDLY